MKVMVLVKANKDSEAGVLPSEQLLADMGKFNQALVNAGILVAGEGLKPSSEGKLVKFSDSAKSVVDGPFTLTPDLLAGFWLWKVRSMDEAVDWLKRAPFQDGEIEIRPVFETEDFAASDPTGELRAQEERLRAQVEGNTKG